MTDTKEREAFEKWAKELSFSLERFTNDSSADRDVRWMWEAWQAALASAAERLQVAEEPSPALASANHESLGEWREAAPVPDKPGSAEAFYAANEMVVTGSAASVFAFAEAYARHYAAARNKELEEAVTDHEVIAENYGKQVRMLDAKIQEQAKAWLHENSAKVQLIEENARLREALGEARDKAVLACIDMAGRYDADIEGCDGDELLKYGEGIQCSFRLAYIIKYGQFPPDGNAWAGEFVDKLKEMQAALRCERKLEWPWHHCKAERIEKCPSKD